MNTTGESPPPSPDLSWLLNAIDAAGDLCYEWDLVSGAIRWGGRVEDMFGSGNLNSIGTADGFANLINVEDLPQRLKALSDHLGREAPFDCEYRVRTADGQFVWVHDRGSVRRRTDGSESRLVGTLRLVTERKRNEVRLERLASFDELTGHYNLPRLRDALEHATTYASRYGLAGAYIVVGIDRLALINSTHGFEAGDAVLIAVGRRLDECLRSSDVIGRVGADRFGVVLSQCSAEQLAAAAERILAAVHGRPIETALLPVHVTVSIGGVVFPASGNTAYDLMAKAETALKQAKREGRDTYVEYRPSERQGALSRRSLDIAIQVQEAMKSGRLCFAFQPVVRAQDQETDFYECLIRMRDDTGDLVPAAAFVPAIEQLGLVRLVDRYALELALNELQQDGNVKLAINISGLTVTDRSWLRSLIAVLKGKPELADRLIIEITETAALHDIEESARFVSAVRDLGCRVALDDFGAGFTSFRHLRALAIDIVKIDGSFVRNLIESVDNQLFIRNLLGLANAFNLQTVAECIESADEAAFLVNEGVQLLQGYYFGRPVLGRPWLEQRHAPAKPRLRIAN